MSLVSTICIANLRQVTIWTFTHKKLYSVVTATCSCYTVTRIQKYGSKTIVWSCLKNLNDE